MLSIKALHAVPSFTLDTKGFYFFGLFLCISTIECLAQLSITPDTNFSLSPFLKSVVLA